MDDWQSLRNHFIRETGGDFPGGTLEATLVEAYANNPALVERSVEKILAGHKAGKVRSPWGALKAEVERGADPANNPTHDHGATRTKLIQRAEQWIRNAGLHYDREQELLDELFGDQGICRTIDTPDARLHLLLLWRELAPIGAAVELEADARGHRYQTQRKELTCRASRPTSDATTPQPTDATSTTQPATTPT